MTLSEREQQRYRRHLALPQVGAAGQEKLRAASVAVVGAGGLGSPLSLYLAAAGIGRIGLIDDDHIERSNLQRQVLYADAEIGQPKADAGRARLLALNPDIEVEAHRLRLTAANAMALFADYDLVADGSDRMSTRYVVNDACVLLGKPLISAAVHQFEGQLTVCLPGGRPCYRCLFPETAGAEPPNCADAGVLGVLPGVMGTLQATEVIKLVLGIGTPLAAELLTYDALEQQTHRFRYPRDPACLVCGDTPSILAPREAAAAPPLPALAPAELMAQLDGAAPPRLIDVREPQEYRAGHIGGASNIPLAALAEQLPGLGDGPIVFICASGARSASACRDALERGLDDVANLEGGMSAWRAAGGATC